MSQRNTGGLESRVAALEHIFDVINQRQNEAERLAGATEDLATNVQGVENVLNSVDQAMRDARTAKRDAKEAKLTADGSLFELARSEHRYRRRSRLMALLAVLISIAAALGIGWWTKDHFDRINHDRSVTTYRSCQIRNEQVRVQSRYATESQQYGMRLFKALQRDDPALARDIENIPRPKSPPAPTPVVCPKP